MKLTERLLLRVDEATARTVRMMAERQQRTIHGQLRFLITVGLNHALKDRSKAAFRQSRRQGAA